MMRVKALLEGTVESGRYTDSEVRIAVGLRLGVPIVEGHLWSEWAA